MADIDINQFGEHESRPEEPTDEKILLDLVTQEKDGPGGLGAWGHAETPSTWEPTCEQETSFRGESQELNS